MTTVEPTFALNHMVAPRLGLRDLFALARRVGIGSVEIRNDIAGQPIVDGTAATTVRSEAEAAGVRIITINALQRFNQWTPERRAEAVELIAYCRNCGAEGLILVPVNDGSGRGEGERQGGLRVALKALKPLLEDAGTIGLVEPLGFDICSLSSKREAVEAIQAVEGESVFRLTHDTFHHHLAGEPQLFPQRTALVHISGVSDPNVSLREMRDSHRGLVDQRDRIGNVEQIAALLDRGYRGPFSFEPFAAELRTLADPAAAIAQSMEFIRAQLEAKAA